MQRLDRYEAAAQKLLESGHAYRCYCTPERIEAVRAEQKANKSSFLGYDGHCRDLTDAQRAEFEQQGLKANIRFRMPEERVVKVHDLIRGDVEVNTKQLDDWVMVRPGGVPLYNFACVIDDVDMKITHVVRGEEHFLNGIKQNLLFEALGHECPEYAHIPLILNQKGGKLSKRDPGVKSTLEYRDLGYPPEAVFNYIALLGWGFSADRDLFTRDEMVKAFQIGSVGKAGAKFDVTKLHWMCGEYIRQWSVDDCLQRSRQWLEPALPDGAWDAQQAWLRNVVACYQERVEVLSEFPDKISWLLDDPETRRGRAEGDQESAPTARRGSEALRTCSSRCRWRAASRAIAALPTTRCACRRRRTPPNPSVRSPRRRRSNAPRGRGPKSRRSSSATSSGRCGPR